jgi:AcrR family transcriptional regulator
MEATRSRRSSAEVRKLIVEAAAREFTRHGYAGTTTRGVAAAAGISLSSLHRQFPTKQRLFSAALLSPFLEVIQSVGSTWVRELGGPAADPELLGRFVERLYSLLREHRVTLVSLLAIASGADQEPAIVAEVRSALEVIRAGLDPVDAAEASAHGLDPDVAGRANRLTTALVTGLVLLAPLLGSDESDEEQEMIRLTTLTMARAVRA